MWATAAPADAASSRRFGDLLRGDGNGGMLADGVAGTGDGAGYDDPAVDLGGIGHG